jgi:hypothetical protein
MSDAMPEQGTPPESVAASIRWMIPESITPQYATNFVVQRMQHEYLISFFQLLPPLLIGDPEQVLEMLKQNSTLEAKCIFQVMIAEDRLSELTALLESGAGLQPAFTSVAAKPATHNDSEPAE